MFSLRARARVKKWFQLCLEFLGLNDVVLKNGNLLVTIEHVENVRTSLSLFVANTFQKKK
jgi:hypothetical protein